jgi:galactose mutarotase-like enzyme
MHDLSESSADGFDTVVLSSEEADLAATFVPSVGMVGASLTHRGEELLGQRKGLRAYAETGSSMGIPLLHPWANRLDGLRYEAAGRTVELDPGRSPLRLDEHGLPIHGVLTASPHWEVVETHAGAGGARLTARLDFAAHEELLAAFPFPHELSVEAELRGAALAVTTLVRPTGDVAVPVSFGWHPYLRLPGVVRPDWEVSMPVRQRAVLDERGIPTGETEDADFRTGRLGSRPLDDLYPALDSPARFTLSGGGRRIAVELGEGYGVAQVYAPPADEHICFEPMTAETNALVRGGPALALVPPGGEYRAVFAIDVG